jgi:hypothetical protein
MPVWYAQTIIPSTEFQKWIWFLDYWKNIEEFRREDFYLAQIAVEIQRTQVKPSSRDRIKIQNKMLKFELKKTNHTTIAKQSPEQRQQISSLYWKTLTGVIGPKANRRKKKLPKKVINKEK